jgi:acetolactate decarboxylase
MNLSSGAYRNLAMLTLVTALIFPILDSARAQGNMQQQTTNDPFGFKAYGVFRSMITERNYRPVVRLKDAFAGATDAVGAVSGLRGEISMIEGRPLVSYGAECAKACPATSTETATLLATASVQNWRAILIDRDLDAKAVDAFVREQAKANGMDEAKPFPFRVHGTITNFVMHVNAAPNPRFKGHGSFDEMAITGLAKGLRLDGYVVGFYAPLTLQGIITHMGDFFHSHYVDEQRTATAHLDTFGIAMGSTLFLPQKQ